MNITDYGDQRGAPAFDKLALPDELLSGASRR